MSRRMCMCLAMGGAKINLAGTSGAPELLWVDGMTRAEVRRAMRLVQAQQAAFLARWGEIHG